VVGGEGPARGMWQDGFKDGKRDEARQIAANIAKLSELLIRK